jgi:hypothetical protein
MRVPPLRERMMWIDESPAAPLNTEVSKTPEFAVRPPEEKEGRPVEN